MAQKTTVHLVDDLDGSTDDVGTVRIGLGEVFHEIDLSKANREKLRELLAPYRQAGRRVDSPRKSKKAPKVRVWARENGYEVGDRGRLSQEVIEAFDKAH